MRVFRGGGVEKAADGGSSWRALITTRAPRGQRVNDPLAPAAFDISRLCGVHDTAGSTRPIRQSMTLEDPATPTSFTVPAPQGAPRGLDYSYWLYEVTYLRRLRQPEAISGPIMCFLMVRGERKVGPRFLSDSPGLLFCAHAEGAHTFCTGRNPGSFSRVLVPMRCSSERHPSR